MPGSRCWLAGFKLLGRQRRQHLLLERTDRSPQPLDDQACDLLWSALVVVTQRRDVQSQPELLVRQGTRTSVPRKLDDPRCLVATASRPAAQDVNQQPVRDGGHRQVAVFDGNANEPEVAGLVDWCELPDGSLHPFTDGRLNRHLRDLHAPDRTIVPSSTVRAGSVSPQAGAAAWRPRCLSDRSEARRHHAALRRSPDPRCA